MVSGWISFILLVLFNYETFEKWGGGVQTHFNFFFKYELSFFFLFPDSKEVANSKSKLEWNS